MNFESLDKTQGVETDPEFEEFKTKVEEGIAYARDLVRRRFEESLEGEKNLEFHGEDHSVGVVNRIEKILNKVREVAPDLISERDVQLGRYAGGFHDVDQFYQRKEIKSEAEGVDDKAVRQRQVRANEEISAYEALQYADSLNKEEDREIFFKEDFDVIREAILATIPGFDPENKTVIQPNLKEDSPLVVRALALADLGTAGIDGGEAFVKEGAALFREENLDIKDALEAVAKGEETISEAQKEAFRSRIIGWLKFQPSFAEGRKALLDHELGNLPDEVKEVLKEEVFSKFDESIEASREFAEKAEQLTFEELLEAVGYKRA
ncbi:MAG: hypothetical protein KGZ30_02610 [Anaplasmataceae bacterium]|nr:hypothetical protein [Anaplasmataceae bacterium]